MAPRTGTRPEGRTGAEDSDGSDGAVKTRRIGVTLAAHTPHQSASKTQAPIMIYHLQSDDGMGGRNGPFGTEGRSGAGASLGSDGAVQTFRIGVTLKEHTPHQGAAKTQAPIEI